MNKPYVPEYQYSVEEFAEHFDHFAKTPSDRVGISQFFEAGYPAGEGRYKGRRYLRAMEYLVTHKAELEEYVVKGSDGSKVLVSFPIVVALAIYFGEMPASFMSIEPITVLILKLADQVKKDFDRE